MVLRYSLCPSCGAEGGCWRCDGSGTVETPAGERPDIIADLRGTKDGMGFTIRIITEPAPGGDGKGEG